MKLITGPTAIVVDGADRPVAGGMVAFRVGALRSAEKPRRPWTGLAIAVVTAVVTMGAMGPRPAPETGMAADAACPVADVRSATDLDDGRSRQATPAASLTPWWQLPRETRWVDPATGMTVNFAHEHDRVADDRPRER